jgi:Dolichyl-phosphate-mannose-protein mannosyltransferase
MNGPSFSPVLADRRVWLFLLISALAAATGFRLVPDSIALDVVKYAGYWTVLAAFILFMWALWRTYRLDLGRLREGGLRRFDWVSLAVVGLGGTVLLVHEAFGFKIVMDELMLVGTSMNMHFTRTVLTPFRGTDIHGTYVIVEGMMDKRPLFFPFLESVLHDLTGYRPENAFVLNGILTFVFLGLINAAGRKLAGRLAGFLGVALFAGLPLLGQNATGGGFDLLNIVMILATLLLGARFITLRDEASFTAFCYSALLMAQVRYESAIFVLPVVGIILWVWRQEGRAILSWPVMVAPVLMITCALQNRIFDIRSSAWQLQSKPGMTKPFSLSYIPDNLAHAWGYFFGKSTDQPDSLVLSALGCVAIIFLLLLVAKRLRVLSSESPISVATVFFTFAFAAHFFLMMCYFWGHFDDPVIRRLSLPAHLWMVIAIMAVLQQFPRPAVAKTLLAVAVLGILAQGVPSMASHAYNQEYLAGLETAWRRRFIAEQPAKDYLMIDNDSILWVAHQVSSTPISSATTRRDSMVFFMKSHTFSNIYVFQRFTIDADTGKMTIRDGDDLGPDYVLEPVTEEHLALLTLSRISRVKEIRHGAAVLSNPEPDHVVPKSRDEIEKERQAYYENFLRQLP